MVIRFGKNCPKGHFCNESFEADAVLPETNEIIFHIKFYICRKCKRTYDNVELGETLEKSSLFLSDLECEND